MIAPHTRSARPNAVLTRMSRRQPATCPARPMADCIMGAGYPELDYRQPLPDRYDDPALRGPPKYILVVGQEPAHSPTPTASSATAIVDLMKRGSKLIVRRSRASPGWPPMPNCGLQLRPGTDAAAGPGHGQRRHPGRPVRPRLRGELVLRVRRVRRTRAREYPPERPRRSPGCPPRRHREAATRSRWRTSHPPVCTWGLALDRTPNGTQAGHCALMRLVAITGQTSTCRAA